MADHQARFVTFEGPEGAGKSTQIRRIQQAIERTGHACLVTREPGGTPLGEALRDVLLHHSGPMRPETELLLMFAARAEHLSRVIEPALAAGTWVLCDRFTDATYAYQGGGRGIDAARIGVIEQWAQGDRRPDMTVVLDVPVDVGQARLKERGAPTDRFEREDVQFYNRVRAVYRERALLSTHTLVDGTMPPDAVFDEICRAIQARFPGLGLAP